jgi:hypothetical protein
MPNLGDNQDNTSTVRREESDWPSKQTELENHPCPNLKESVGRTEAGLGNLKDGV